MEFGRLEPGELKNVDFTLPPDSQQNIDVLQASPGTDKFELHVGAMKWGRKEWLGKLYPAKTKESIKGWKSEGLLSAEFFISGHEENKTPDYIKYFCSKF